MGGGCALLPQIRNNCRGKVFRKEIDRVDDVSDRRIAGLPLLRWIRMYSSSVLAANPRLSLVVCRAKYFANPAGADRRDDFVRAEAGAGGRGPTFAVDCTGGVAGRTGLVLSDDRTLSGVTRRTGVHVEH